VHRDVKPSNVLLRADGTPVLTDLGLALLRVEAAQEGRLTASNVILGTADYLAPEQVVGAVVDERSDLYALGMVLYEMLAGVVPFAGRTPLETLQAQVEEEPPPLPERVPTAVRAVVMRALQKRPEDRFPSAAAFADALVL
jgi:serine/threonine-protein kinase